MRKTKDEGEIQQVDRFPKFGTQNRLWTRSGLIMITMSSIARSLQMQCMPWPTLSHLYAPLFQ